MSDNWFPWQDHHGKGRPVPIGTFVQVVAQRPTGEKIQLECYADDALGWDWANYGKVFPDDKDDKINWRAGRILRYRSRMYSSGVMLDKLAADILNRTVSVIFPAGSTATCTLTMIDNGTSRAVRLPARAVRLE
jgi:hypothetical protein